MEDNVGYYQEKIQKAGFTESVHLIANLFLAHKGIEGYYIVVGNDSLFTYKYERQITFEEIDNGTISS